MDSEEANRRKKQTTKARWPNDITDHKGRIRLTPAEAARRKGRKQYRGRYQITRDILHVLPARKTRLMFECFLSFQQLAEYLPVMRQNGLITIKGMPGVVRVRQTVSITNKGRRALAMLDELDAILPFGGETAEEKNQMADAVALSGRELKALVAPAAR